MALQATVTLLGLSGWVALETVLCALVVMWLALSTHRARPAPAKELKPDPFNDDTPAPLPKAQGHVEVGPTDLDLSIDSEAFQAQVGRRCDLELDALCDKVLQDLEDEFGGAPASAAPSPPNVLHSPHGVQRRVEARPANLDLIIDLGTCQAQIRRDFEAFQAQIGRRCDLTFQGPGVDFEAFQAQTARQCDLELTALCESAINDQSTKVMQDLEGEFGGGPLDAQSGRQPASAEPGTDFEANVELHIVRAIEDMCSRAIDTIDGALDCMCAAVLEALHDECRGSCALGDDVQGDYA